MPIPLANQPIAEMTRMAFLSSLPFASLNPINDSKALNPLGEEAFRRRAYSASKPQELNCTEATSLQAVGLAYKRIGHWQMPRPDCALRIGTSSSPIAAQAIRQMKLQSR